MLCNSGLVNIKLKIFEVLPRSCHFLVAKEPNIASSLTFFSQHLLTFSMVGDRAPYWPHRWATLSKWNRLTNLVVLVIERLGVDQLEGWPTMPLLEVTSPASYSSSMAEELALMPLTVSHKKRLIEEFGSLENSMEKGEAFKALRSIFPIAVNETKVSKEERSEKECLKLRLLLSATQMVTENYPLPLAGSMQERYANFKPTSDKYVEVSSTSPLFSVDCEMCLTDEGSELTRICVVDSTLAVVYHKLVKPTNQIRNYLTRWGQILKLSGHLFSCRYSGITPDMLEDVTTRLEDVQNDLQQILPPDAILVGQSLNCDLAAMKMVGLNQILDDIIQTLSCQFMMTTNALTQVHPYVIDTSVCYNITGDRRRKSKLSTLAHLFLNMKIQTQGKHGHSPVEDAQTAMTLVNLKLEKGLAFGDVVLGGQVPVMDEEGVYKMPASAMDQGNPKKDWKHENLMTSLSKTLANHEKTVALVTDGGASQGYVDFEGFRQELKLSQTLATSAQALEAARNAAVSHNLTICHLAFDEEKEADRLSKAQEAAADLHNFTSINGMFILILAGTDTQNAVAGVTLRKPEADKL